VGETAPCSHRARLRPDEQQNVQRTREACRSSCTGTSANLMSGHPTRVRGCAGADAHRPHAVRDRPLHRRDRSSARGGARPRAAHARSRRPRRPDKNDADIFAGPRTTGVHLRHRTRSRRPDRAATGSVRAADFTGRPRCQPVLPVRRHAERSPGRVPSRAARHRARRRWVARRAVR
jgi:hypothetical protein